MTKPNSSHAAPDASSDKREVPAQWSWHYRTLLRIRERLTGKQDEREAAIRDSLDRGGSDFGDAATQELKNSDILAKLSFAEAELNEVDAAIHRIFQGTYGICMATGRKIAPARLRAVPWTKLSHEAAERLEKTSSGS